MKKLTVVNMIVLAVVAIMFYNLEWVVDMVDDNQRFAAMLVIVGIGAVIRFAGVWVTRHEIAIEGLPKVSVTEKTPEPAPAAPTAAE